jgi:hypothetical protein
MKILLDACVWGKATTTVDMFRNSKLNTQHSTYRG